MHIMAGFKLSSDTFLQPDVSFLRAAQIQATPHNRYYEGAPAVAIEILTGSNNGIQLHLKMAQYFAHGSEEVWIVDPKARNVRIRYSNGNSQIIGEGEFRSNLFPAWSIPVHSLFRDRP